METGQPCHGRTGPPDGDIGSVAGAAISLLFSASAKAAVGEVVKERRLRVMAAFFARLREGWQQEGPLMWCASQLDIVGV